MSVMWRLTLGYAACVMAGGGAILLVTAVFLLRYVPERISAAQFVPTRGDLIRAFAPPAAWTLIGLLIGSFAVGWALARWMLRPVHEMQHATDIVARGSLSHRIRMRGRDDEFRRLADAFDTMVDRVERRVDAEQRFAANASHELRTPLAVTRSLIDVARNDPELDVRVLLDRLAIVNDRAVASTQALLLLSQVDADVVSHERVDVSLAADEAVESLHAALSGTDLALELDLDTATVLGDETLIIRLVANLVHNAIVHNVPSAGCVRVRTWTEADRAELEVANSGPLISAEQAGTLTDAFQRRARIRADSASPSSNHDAMHAGVGLGLTIAASIVRAHRGTLAITPRAEGGLVVRVSFNAA